jgi:hypothetical protein
MCMKLLELLKLLEIVNMDSSFPMSQSTLDLDSWFKSYRYLKISALLWLGSQPLSMQQILPKSAQRKNFEIPPKIEILVFFKNKNFYVYKRH